MEFDWRRGGGRALCIRLCFCSTVYYGYLRTSLSKNNKQCQNHNSSPLMSSCYRILHRLSFHMTFKDWILGVLATHSGGRGGSRVYSSLSHLLRFIWKSSMSAIASLLRGMNLRCLDRWIFSYFWAQMKNYHKAFLVFDRRGWQRLWTAVARRT